MLNSILIIINNVVRQAAARAIKRVRADSSDDSDAGSSSGSEFKLPVSDSGESEFHSAESNLSSDFNPFDDDSDSEGKCDFLNIICFNFSF